MNIEQLRTLCHVLPDGASVLWSKNVLQSLLDAFDGLGPVEPPAEGLLTLSQVAERVGRAVSTVKGWCNRGELPGAFKLNGRDWRVPPASLEDYLHRQREPTAPGGNEYDLSSWRNER
jgi:excisionase family DNA binding protein